MSAPSARRLAILLVLVGTLALAGCTQAVDRLDETRDTLTGGDDAGGAGAIVDDPSGLTAMQAHEAAVERAEAWDGDAELTHVSTVEMEDLERMAITMTNATPETTLLEPDPRMGDGRAPQWVFGFATPDRDRAIDVLVTQHRGTHVIEDDREADDVHAITEDAWRIDSDEVLEKVREHPEVGPQLEDNPERVIHWTLVFPEKPGHLWQIWVQDAAEGPRGEPAAAPVFVNATTGELVDPFTPPKDPERFDHEGTLSADEPRARFDLDASADEALTVHVNAQLTWDADARLNLTLLDADGSPVGAEDRSRGSSSVTAEYRSLDPGDYELQVALEDEDPEADEVAFTLEGQALFVDE